MFSDALKAMDRNTVQYMIDEQKAEIERNKTEIEQLSQTVSNKNAALAEKDKELEQLRAQLALFQNITKE